MLLRKKWRADGNRGAALPSRCVKYQRRMTDDAARHHFAGVSRRWASRRRMAANIGAITAQRIR